MRSSKSSSHVFLTNLGDGHSDIRALQCQPVKVLYCNVVLHRKVGLKRKHKQQNTKH